VKSGATAGRGHRSKYVGGTAMSGFTGLIIVSVVGAIIVTLCFVQDSVGSLKFWRSR
jgi:hypothetical protein